MRRVGSRGKHLGIPRAPCIANQIPGTRSPPPIPPRSLLWLRFSCKYPVSTRAGGTPGSPKLEDYVIQQAEPHAQLELRALLRVDVA